MGIYRHGIDLALKDGIRTAAAWARRDGITDLALETAKLNESLATRHSLGKLVQKLTDLLDLLQLGNEQKLPADTLAALQSLHALDESGQTFRYAMIKVGSGRAHMFVAARPDQVHFDLKSVASRLDKVATILCTGCPECWRRTRSSRTRCRNIPTVHPLTSSSHAHSCE